MKQPSPRTLTRTIDRAFQFLSAEGSDPAIRRALQAAGFTDAERQLGWSSLHRLSNFVPAPSAQAGGAAENAFRTAQLALQGEGAGFIRRAGAALGRRHPEVAASVFAGVDAQTSILLAVTTVLSRLAGVGDAVLETLALRGFGPDALTRLSSLTRTVESGVAPVGDDADGLPADRRNELVALNAWYDDWSETARACITQRGKLIRLGLAKRRSAKKSTSGSANPVHLASAVRAA